MPAAEGGARSLAPAARQRILQRMAPALRHDMVVPLQSLGMMTEAVKARLDRGALKPEDLQESVTKLHRLSRRAVANCLQVASWMDTSGDHSVPLAEGTREVVELLTSSLNFRGFQLRSDVPELAIDVDRRALRFLLAAMILCLADEAPGPGALLLSAEASSSHAVLALHWTAAAEPPAGTSSAPLPEPLAWHELQALAGLESAELHRGEQSMLLRLPRKVVTTPLKMMPV